MRVEAATDPDTTVAADAVALRMAADARVEVAFRLKLVVLGRDGRARPHRRGRVKARVVVVAARAALGDAQAHVARQAEALLLVAAPAALHRHPSLDGVQGDVVRRMNAP